MSSEYLHSDPERSEIITQMEIKTRLAHIEDIIFQMNIKLNDLATALANLRQETTPIDAQDRTRWEGQAQ